ATRSKDETDYIYTHDHWQPYPSSLVPNPLGCGAAALAFAWSGGSGSREVQPSRNTGAASSQPASGCGRPAGARQLEARKNSWWLTMRVTANTEKEHHSSTRWLTQPVSFIKHRSMSSSLSSYHPVLLEACPEYNRDN